MAAADVSTAERNVAELDRLFADEVGLSADADRRYFDLRDACLDHADASPEAAEVYRAAGLPV